MTDGYRKVSLALADLLAILSLAFDIVSIVLLTLLVMRLGRIEESLASFVGGGKQLVGKYLRCFYFAPLLSLVSCVCCL